MNLLILGATGMVGRHFVSEALHRGHEVTACTRTIPPSPQTSSNLRFEALDILSHPDRLDAFVARHDVTLSALNPGIGHEGLLVTMTQVLLRVVLNAKKRLYLTGGAATLYLADGSGHTVLSAPGFLSEAIRPIAEACGRQDQLLSESDGMDWICLRPAALLIEDRRTGRYALGRDTLVTQEDGVSRISCADFAVAMLDLIELCPKAGQRLTVGW